MRVSQGVSAKLALGASAIACVLTLACAGERSPAGPISASREARLMNAPADAPYRSELETAATGLVFSSEADHPFEYFYVPASLEEPLTIAAFRSVMGIPSSAAIDERPLDEFLSHHIERVDPADAASLALVPRYQQLKDTLRESLNSPAVFCLGQVSKRCYLAGTDERGNVVGLVTTAVET